MEEHRRALYQEQALFAAAPQGVKCLSDALIAGERREAF